MAKLAIKKASTDVTTYVFIQDSSKTTGVGLTGLVYNTTDLVASYVRPLGTRQALTLATLAAADSAHSDGGFKEVDATNMPGVYRLDLPDAVCATGVPSVVVMLKGATNMSPVVLEIQLTDFDLNAAGVTVDGIADAVWDEALSGHTAAGSVGKQLSDAALEATLTAIKGAGWTTQQTLSYIATTMVTEGFFSDMSSAIYEIQNDLENGGRLDLLIDSIIAHLVAIKGAGWTNQTLVKIVTDIAAISAGSGATPQQIWEYTTRTITGLPTMPTDWLTAAGLKADAVSEIQSGLATSANLQTVDDNVDAIKAKTDNLPASPAAVGSAMTLTAAYDKAKDDVLTPLAVVDSIVDGLKTTLDNIHDTDLPAVKTETAAIKAKTDNLPATPASAGEYTSALTAIQNDLDNPDQYKADVSALTNVTLTAAYDKAKDDVLTPLGVVDGIVDAIKVQTDKIPATPASAGEYTANIGAIKAKTDNLPLSPASSGEYTSALTAIQNDLDNPNQYKADVSNLALQATSLAIKGQTDKIPAAPAQTGEYNAALAAIQSDLDNPAQYKADVSGLATTAHVQEVENKIDAIDVTVNTIPTNPLLATAYTAPDNEGIAAILEDTGTTIPATLAGLATSTEVGAIALLDETVIGSYTVQDILKILAAKMVGKATGGSTATITYRGVDDTSDVIIETVDSNGNRSAVTLTV